MVSQEGKIKEQKQVTYYLEYIKVFQEKWHLK